MVEVARLYRCDNGSSLKAFADVIINGVLIKGVRVVVGKNDNLFVALPQEQAKDGKWYNKVILLEDETKEEFQEVVLQAYNI